jgi:alkanesulfonate monooxygenase SsuD/methylene tetrahydromethanopterin reductase-like flavin-dependent oxidoreductase (luciferase family)/hemerythrin-like domain-containing protein
VPDYGHDLVFGCFLPPAAAAPEQVLHLADEADARGLDLVTVQDHPYQAGYLDAWTLLSVIAARTTRISVMPNVANLPLRPPAVLARSAASLDLLTGGRVELGLGAGAFWDAIEAMGGPRRTPGQAVVALEEAIAVIRALWSGERTPRIDGEHYRLHGAKPGPVPAHPIGIWLGAYKPRMLGVTGRLADGWLPSMGYVPPEQLAAMNAVIDESATAAGRSAQDVRRYYNIDASTDRPDVWAERLAELALTEGVSGFIVTVELGGTDALAVFAEEVVPVVRSLVAAERGAGSTASMPVETADASVPAVRPVTADWDESTRPQLPDQDHPSYGDGTRLVEIHDHLRGELAQVRDLIRQVREGAMDVGAARSAINRMTMRQNAWSVGAYCESYCRVVTIHHSLEDRRVFPQLRAADAQLGAVLDRLSSEHLVIHDLLEAVDASLVAMVTDPSALTELIRSVDLLADRLTSHLSYEERQLVGPLNRYGMHG